MKKEFFCLNLKAFGQYDSQYEVSFPHIRFLLLVSCTVVIFCWVYDNGRCWQSIYQDNTNQWSSGWLDLKRRCKCVFGIVCSLNYVVIWLRFGWIVSSRMGVFLLLSAKIFVTLNRKELISKGESCHYPVPRVWCGLWFYMGCFAQFVKVEFGSFVCP